MPINEVHFRLAKKEDENFLLKIRNRNRYYFFSNKIINKKQHHEWFSQEIKRKNRFIFIIVLKKNNKITRLGTITLLNINFKKHTAELGRFIILKKYRYLGYGSIVLSKFKKICKAFLISQLYLYVKADNILALIFYFKNNFTIFDIKNNKIRMESTI